MSWVRDRRGNKKPIRVTFTIYPDRDEDLYEIMSSLKFGQMSEYIRNAIRATAGMPAEQLGSATRGKSRRDHSSRVAARPDNGQVSPHLLASSPPHHHAAVSEPVQPIDQAPQAPPAPPVNEEDIERLRALNRMFL